MKRCAFCTYTLNLGVISHNHEKCDAWKQSKDALCECICRQNWMGEAIKDHSAQEQQIQDNYIRKEFINEELYIGGRRMPHSLSDEA